MGDKRKILAMIDWYRPGYLAGGPIRSLSNLVEALGDEFNFSIVTRNNDFGVAEPYPDIVPNRWTPQTDGSRVWYADAPGRSYGAMRKLLAATEYDILYTNSMFSLPFMLFPLRLSRGMFPDRPTILAPRGMLHSGALSIKSTKKRLFLFAMRSFGLHKGTLFQATDDLEGDNIRAVFGPDARVASAPNLPPMKLAEFVAPDKRPGELKLVFLSRILGHKGVDYLLERLRGRTQRISLDIYGPDEQPGYWARCERIVADLPDNVTVRKHEPIPPQEIPGTLQGYHVYALPTRGENFGHSIFEALAAGRPVLISDLTPWRGLEARSAGFDLPLGNPAAFEAAIDRYAAMDSDEFGRWARSAYALAADESRNNAAIAANRRLFAEAGSSLPS